MSALRNYLNKIKPNFQEGGKLHAFESVFDGFESFLYVPNTTAKSGASIHDSIDSKRIMSFVVIALIPDANIFTSQYVKEEGLKITQANLQFLADYYLMGRKDKDLSPKELW